MSQRFRSRLSQGVVAMLLTIAIASLWFIAGAWLQEVAQARFRSQQLGAQLGVSGEGDVFVSRYGEGRSRLYDERGRELEQYPSTAAPSARMMVERTEFTRLGWEQRILGLSDLRSGDPWYIVRPVGSEDGIYLVGYDWRSNRRIGYITRKGFRESEPARDDLIPISLQRAIMSQVAAAQYLTPGRAPLQTTFTSAAANPQGDARVAANRLQVLHVISNGQLMKIDIGQRSVETLATVTDIISAERIQYQTAGFVPFEQLEWDWTLMVRTKDAILLCDLDGQTKRRYQVPAALQSLDLQVFPYSEERCVMVVESGGIGTLNQIYRVDEDGEIDQKLDVSADRYIVFNPVGHPLTAALFMPSPIENAVGLLTTWWSSRYMGTADVQQRFLQQVQRPMLLGLVVIVPISLALSVACYYRERQLQAASWGWPLFVFLTGVPGWLGYRFRQAGPVQVPCEHCRQRVSRSHDQCPQCGEPFGAPALRGTEVFA